MTKVESKNAFYYNKPCTILSEVGDDEVVIEIETGANYYCGGEGDVYDEDPTFSRLIVNKDHISKELVHFESVFKEIEEAKRASRSEIANLKSEANKDIARECTELRKELQGLEDKAHSYEGLTEMLKYLEGKIKYVVYDENYRWGISKFDELTCNSQSSELVSVSFRSKEAKRRHGNFKMYVGTYDDDSGKKYEVNGFTTLEDAKIFAKQQLESKVKQMTITHRVAEECSRWGITSQRIENFLKEEKATKDRKTESKISSLELELTRLKLESLNE